MSALGGPWTGSASKPASTMPPRSRSSRISPNTRAALGAVPTQDTLVLERFFDESGGMQLVLHAPFGSRINKAWGLALRKRFCRQFNFELQAAATEDALLLSLGPQHSFPLADVFRYLHPATAQGRARAGAARRAGVPDAMALEHDGLARGAAIPRRTEGAAAAAADAGRRPDGGGRFPMRPPASRTFPGDRQIPDHPLVTQAVRDCLEEAMDFDGLARVLDAHPRRRAAAGHPRHAGAVADLPRDSERAAVGVSRRCAARGAADAGGLSRAGRPSRPRRRDIGALDPAAIARVRDEAQPDPRDADELHDAL